MDKSFGKTVCFDSLKKAASHYRGETNYCSVIALAIATGCKFGKARSMMAKQINRKTGHGTYRWQAHTVYESLGLTVERYFPRKGFQVRNAAANLPNKGTFLVYSLGHVSCLKDGVMQDWVMLPRATKKLMKEVYQVS